MKYLFADFVLDEERFELRRANGELVPMQMRALELLLLLVRHSGSTVAKETILREVWGTKNISRSALPTQVLKLRRILGDDREPREQILTVPRKGLRFLADVTVTKSVETEASITVDSALSADFDLDAINAVGKQPTLAVMRFAESDHESSLQGVASALPADVISAVSRARVLRVISGDSSFLLGQKQESSSLVKTALGADYCLKGHVSRFSEMYLVYAELSDTESQAVIWSEQFEVKPEDIYDLQSVIVGQLVAQIERRIHLNEARTLALRQPQSLTAWQAFHIGSAFLLRRGPANMAKARVMFQRATRIDQGFARAWSGLAHTFAFEVIHGSSSDRDHAKHQLMSSAENALDADPDDPSANLFMGRALSMSGSEQKPISWFSRALELAPSFAMAHQQLGSSLAFSGNCKHATEYSFASLQLSPLDPLRFSNFAALAIAKLRSGDMAGAIEWGQKAGKVPFDDILLLVTGLCANHLGSQTEEAATIAARIKGAFPAFSRRDILTQQWLGEQLAPMVDGILTTYGVD